jgi:hypothetical protein
MVNAETFDTGCHTVQFAGWNDRLIIRSCSPSTAKETKIMILGAELGLTIYGLIALIRGQFSIGKARVVTGWQGRVLGAICMSVLPIAFAIGLIYGIVMVMNGVDITQQSTISLIWIDLVGIASVLLPVWILGPIFFRAQQRNASGSVSPAFASSIDPQNPYGRV